MEYFSIKVKFCVCLTVSSEENFAPSPIVNVRLFSYANRKLSALVSRAVSNSLNRFEYALKLK